MHASILVMLYFFLKNSTVNVTINKEDIRMYIYKQIKLTSAIQM